MLRLALLCLAITFFVSVLARDLSEEQQVLLGHVHDLTAVRSWEEADFISPAENSGSLLARFCPSLSPCETGLS